MTSNGSYMASTWFVTGATGLVGSSIIEKLREADLAVIGLVREKSPKRTVDWLVERGVKIVIGELLEPSSFETYLATCDVVVHTAAAVLETDRDVNYRVNTEGTKLLVEAMTKYDVQRLIHISTAGVYGQPQLHLISEDQPLKPVGAYSQSKLLAENILREHPGISLTIIRPPYIFGDIKRDRNLLPTLYSKFSKKLMPKAWRFNPSFGFVHALDLASLVILAGSREKTPSIIYNIQSFSLTYLEILNFLSETQDKRIVKLILPFTVLFSIGMIIDLSIFIFRRTPLLARKRVKFLRGNWDFSTARVEKDLGWSPVHSEPQELSILFTNYIHYVNGVDPDINIVHESK
ncbi:MAG: NAD-dependent epimerase/dehydratase family protein [Candidatus Kariarchaeaceae archaeon]